MIRLRKSVKHRDSAQLLDHCIGVSILLLLFFMAMNVRAEETFDHFSTGFPLDGAHMGVTCERCHAGGVFEGTSPTCVNCHSAQGLV